MAYKELKSDTYSRIIFKCERVKGVKCEKALFIAILNLSVFVKNSKITLLFA